MLLLNARHESVALFGIAPKSATLTARVSGASLLLMAAAEDPHRNMKTAASVASQPL